MRILMVSHEFPRAPGDAAGAGVWRLAEGLIGRGHDVTVIATADRGEIGEPVLGSVPVRRVRYASAEAETLGDGEAALLRAARSPRAALLGARMVRALTRVVEEETQQRGAQVIHAHSWVPAGLAVRRARRHGRPFVVTLHGADVALAQRVPGGSALMTRVLRAATTVTAASSPLAVSAAAALGVGRADIPVTPMPLGLRHRADLDQARSGAVFAGPLTRANGVHDLLAALALLRRDGVPVDLTVIGDGPERASLKAQSMALGLRVTFVGAVPPEEAASHLRDKAVFALPALEAGSGQAVADALVLGIPVVATPTGSIPDALDDPEAGILVAPADPYALATAIRTVVRGERYRMGAWRAGRMLSDRLSPERVAERFETLYTNTRTSSSGTMPTRKA